MGKTVNGTGFRSCLAEKWVYRTMMAGAFLSCLCFIGSMSDIISHSNPGEKRKNDAVSVVKGFLHERKMPPLLTRRVRAHFSLLYTMRGTTADFREMFDLMPREMANELAANMRLIDDVKPGRAGLMHNVPVFSCLEAEDLIRIGCRLRPHRASPPVVDDQNNPVGGQIMKEGVRGTEMWLVFEGEVRIERGGAETGAPRQNLGKLRFGEYFGELAVLDRRDARTSRALHAISLRCNQQLCAHGFEPLGHGTVAARERGLGRGGCACSGEDQGFETKPVRRIPPCRGYQRQRRRAIDATRDQWKATGGESR